MIKIAISALAVALLAGMTPALARTDCDTGFKTFLTKMSTRIDKSSGAKLAVAVSKSVDAYNSCQAADSFSPHGVWDKINADLDK